MTHVRVGQSDAGGLLYVARAFSAWAGLFPCSRQGRSGLLGLGALPAAVLCKRQNGLSITSLFSTMAPQNGIACSRVHSSPHITIHAGLTPQSVRSHPSPCLQASGCVRMVERPHARAASATATWHTGTECRFRGSSRPGPWLCKSSCCFRSHATSISTPAVTPSLRMFHCAGRPCSAHGNGSCDHTCEGALLSHKAIVTHGQIKRDNADRGEIKI